MRHARIACLAAALVMGAGGCSWFRGKDKPAPEADGAAATEPAVAPEAAAAATPTAPAAEPAQGPVAVAMDFLEMHRRLGNSGLPQRADMAAYDAFLCPSLAQAVRAAHVRQEQFRAEHPEDKPPFVEGDLFSSLFEGPDGYETRDASIQPELARVVVAMNAGEGDKATRWKDTLVMRLDDGIWCLDDVEYGGDWAFANKGSLRATLAP